MNIIYLSSSCSDEKFNSIRDKGYTRKLPQAQKYHLLLREGIAQNPDTEIIALTALPTNRTWTKKTFFKREEERINNIRYIYGGFINVPVLIQLSRKIGATREIKKLCKSGKDTIIICDILNQSLSSAARKMGSKLKIPVIGIVTDVPGHTSGASRKEYNLLRRIASDIAESNGEKNLGKYDAYLLLTEEMNSVVNKFGKPYIVLEGHCDSKMELRENRPENKTTPKVAMYAGGIHEEFGIKRMVEAFAKGDFKDWQLHIYGDGNYHNQLEEMTKTVDNIKYFGVVSNNEIVEKQLESTLLLNPRLTDAEYVKYSFPSKTMECMASGTPLCTTRLPGMPKEYYPFVYFFDDETTEGMLKTFKEVLVKPETEYFELGCRAKNFVLENKNNITQAKKLLDFAKGLKAKNVL